jgi:hypothetical protein
VTIQDAGDSIMTYEVSYRDYRAVYVVSIVVDLDTYQNASASRGFCRSDRFFIIGLFRQAVCKDYGRELDYVRWTDLHFTVAAIRPPIVSAELMDVVRLHNRLNASKG